MYLYKEIGDVKERSSTSKGHVAKKTPGKRTNTKDLNVKIMKQTDSCRYSTVSQLDLSFHEVLNPHDTGFCFSLIGC